MYIPYEERARILSIDPGTTHTGLAIVDHGMGSGGTYIPYATTYCRANITRDIPWKVEMCGARAVAVEEFGKVLKSMLEEWQPTVIIAEAPFLKRMPVPFKALSELMLMFNVTASTWDPRVPFIQVPPIKAKAMMGIAGKGSQKATMRDRVLEEKWWVLPKYAAKLDEHAIDAISVGLWGVYNVLRRGDTA